jgi:hypothetical protein
LHAWQRRFEHLGELRPIFAAIEQAARRVRRRRPARNAVAAP